MTNYYEEIGFLPREDVHAWTYAIGFALSLICTFGAYLLAVNHVLAIRPLVVAILLLALVQVVVQAISFLHLGIGKRSRLQLLVLGFAILVVGILVLGSVWIMFSLNERMSMTPAQMEQYMQDQDAF